MVSFDLVRSKAEVDKMLERIDGVQKVALDIETTGLEPSEGRIRLIQLGVHQKNWVIDLNYVNPNWFANDILNDLNREFLIHYSPFETEWIYYHLGIQLSPTNIFDSWAASRALNETPAGLKAVVERYLNFDMSKEEQTSNWGNPELTKSQLEYAALDVDVLVRLEPLLSSKLSGSDDGYEKHNNKVRREAKKRFIKCDEKAITDKVLKAEMLLSDNIEKSILAADTVERVDYLMLLTYRTSLFYSRREGIELVARKRKREILAGK